MRLWPRPFFVPPEDLEVLRRAADGSSRYRWCGFEFTIVHGPGLSWWCHTGFRRPGELVSHAHEAGWGSFTHAAVLRKVLRAIRSTVRDELRDGGLHDRQPDARLARAMETAGEGRRS